MSAVHHLVLFVRKLLAALRNPFHRSLRRLLRLWTLVKLYLFSKKLPSKKLPLEQRKNLPRAQYGGHGGNDICASKVPTRMQLTPIVTADSNAAGPSPTSPAASDSTLPTPIPIQVTSPSHLSPYILSRSSASITSLTEPGDVSSDDDTSNHLHTREYSEISRSRPRPRSMASSIRSSARNSHMGAEESALRSLGGRSFIIPSRSATPCSRRSPSPTDLPFGPPSRAHSPIYNLKARSMVELYPGNRRLHDARESSRARSAARVTSGSRSRSPTPSSSSRIIQPSIYHVDPVPAHIAANPCSSPEPEFEVTMPITPCMSIARYDRNVKIKRKDMRHIIPELTTTYTHDNLPEHWVPLAHPEGALYWVHATRPIYTDAYLCEPNTLEEINRFLKEMDRIMEDRLENMSDDWELVLELTNDEQTNDPQWLYYFVDHVDRTLFWLHPFEATPHLSGFENLISSRSHLHYKMQEAYWTHWEMFPHNRDVPEPLLQELIGILTHAGIDSITSLTSTTLYSEADLTKLLRYVKTIPDVGGNHGFAACIVGRLMGFCADSRFINFYGQSCARLSRDQSVLYEWQDHRSALMFLSAFLFFSPEVHLKALGDLFTDWVVRKHMWVEFISNLQREWAEFTLYATVLLNANVAFLAIPSVDNGPDVRSPSQVISYLSVVTSIGSIITGLLLIRQHRIKSEETAVINQYLTQRKHSKHGFESLAIWYSLPYSLLMWSMIAFLSAFSWEALARPTALLSRIPVACGWTIIGLLVMWCAIMGWERENPIQLGWLLVSWVERLRWKKDQEPVVAEGEEEVTEKSDQQSWLHRAIPRKFTRSSTRSSDTEYGITVEMVDQNGDVQT